MSDIGYAGKGMPIAGVLLACLLSTSAVAEESILSFLGQGKADLSFRYRYEFVDQAGLSDDAHASTLRSRLTYLTPKEEKISLVLEADNILRLGGANYSDGNRTIAQHPVVADPVGTEVNQAYVFLQPERRLNIALGRQRINLDDQRFVGGVGWRQNEQTYDAGRVRLDLPAGMVLDYSYLWNINRIFGPEGGAQASDWDCACHILNVGFQPIENAELVLFAYWQDLKDAPALANQTLGLRFSGAYKISNDTTTDYLLSYARQSDAGRNTVDYEASYYHAWLGIKKQPWSLRVGLEALGGESGRSGAAFVTPLATLHAFNGWADKFLATPDAGLVDYYGKLTLDRAGLVTSLAYHRFSAEAGSGDFGTEWDLSFATKVNEQLGLLGKFAFYDSDGFATDTNKFWIMVSFAP